MAAEAVALKNLSADVFRDVLENGAKVIAGTGCAIVPETYLEMVEEYTDWKVEHEAAERLTKSNPKLYTEKEALKKLGISEAEMEAAEDIELA